MTDPMNGLTQYTYDANNQMLTMTEPRNVPLNIPTFTNVYTDEGRVLTQTAADNGIYQFGYNEDVNGNLTQTDVTNPRGFITRYNYDSNGYFSGGNVISETRVYGQPEQQVYAYQRQSGSNLLLSATDTLTDTIHRTVSYTYDGNGNLLTITRLSGTLDAVTTTMTYDPTFNVVNSITDPLNHTTQISIDPVTGNRTSISDPITSQTRVTTMSYNTKGQLTSSTTSPIAPVGVEYQPTGEISAVVDPLGNRTTFGVDSTGRLVSSSDPSGNPPYAYEYDGLDRLTKVTDSLHAPLQYSYDANSFVQSITDARNNTTSYLPDNKNRLSRRTDPLLAFETFEYDKGDNLTKRTDRKQQITTTTYDGLDRKKVTTFFDNSTVSFTFDAGDRLTQIDDSTGGRITYAYDLLDRLLSETGPKGAISYTYDAAGRRSTMTVRGQPIVNYTYDNANRLTQIVQGTSIVNMTYDAANRRSTLTLPNGIQVTYGYDGASRLNSLMFTKGVNSVGNLTYTYDATGRRTQIGGSLARTGLPQAVASANYNVANQLTQWNGASLTYDANGNMTGDGTNSYAWDSRNQLTSVTGASITASFLYDSLGKRLTKTINGAATSFLYDGENVVQELSGNSPSANLLTGLGVDETFTRTDSSGSSNFIADALNSTIALLDGSGTIITQFTYEPFGKESAAGAVTDNSFRHTGREDDNDGLYYHRARYYNAALQRFISEDPIGVEGGINLYAYVGNNPTILIDPTGLSPLSYDQIAKLVASNNKSGQSNELIICMAYKESSFDPGAMQRWPNTARGLLGVTKPAARDMRANWNLLGDPALNIQTGTRYLANRIKVAGNLREGLAKYGEGLPYADSILKCEECLKHEASVPVGCKTVDCLQPLHGR